MFKPLAQNDRNSINLKTLTTLDDETANNYYKTSFKARSSKSRKFASKKKQ